MSAVNYDAVLFQDGSPTYFLVSEWRNRAPAVPLPVSLVLLDGERKSTQELRSAWRASFPDRQPLPDEPLADEDGRGTQALWDAMR